MTTPTHRDPQSLLVQTWRVIRGLWLAEAALVVAIWVAVPPLLPGPRETVQDGWLFALIFHAVGLVDRGSIVGRHRTDGKPFLTAISAS